MTIGPAPMIRIEEMSLRFGIRCQVKCLNAGIKKGVVTAALRSPARAFRRGARPLSPESPGREGRDARMTDGPQIGGGARFCSGSPSPRAKRPAGGAGAGPAEAEREGGWGRDLLRRSSNRRNRLAEVSSVSDVFEQVSAMSPDKASLRHHS